MIPTELYKRAFEISILSPDTSNLVGCVIATRDGRVLAESFNQFPHPDMDKPARHERPEKYEWFVHAESSALAQIATTFRSSTDSICYSTQIPCPVCMGMLIRAGIRHIVCPPPEGIQSSNKTKWTEGASISKQMAHEVGLTIQFVSKEQIGL